MLQNSKVFSGFLQQVVVVPLKYWKEAIKDLIKDFRDGRIDQGNVCCFALGFSTGLFTTGAGVSENNKRGNQIDDSLNV